MQKNNRWKWLILLCLWAGYAQAFETHSTVVQISTIQALLKGVYDGEMSFGQLKTLGDFGFGTFNGLDGEMAAFDGQFYQVKSDGTVHLVPDTLKTPYAAVHFFQTDKTVVLNAPIQSYPHFQNALDPHLPSRNRPYALKVTGTFDYLKTRSVSKQRKPYPPTVAVVAHQSIFEFENITGTAVGYWFPDYMDKLAVPGYHLHFISEDKQHGGHVLNCRLSKATIAIDFIDSVKLLIPQDAAFQGADFSTYSRKELDKVVKDND
ncbi:MAG TPA: acetolactate decarboxylase [Thioploca sp.]|nr:MAG: acetolactate decarboxylase [Gammaproteobacteria bacterium]HDN27768.1 acetolactate decarboxylase [Thioploca sp.]